MEKQGIDVLCFTGHKGLFGPQGTGGIAVANGVEILAICENSSPYKESVVKYSIKKVILIH